MPADRASSDFVDGLYLDDLGAASFSRFALSSSLALVTAVVFRQTQIERTSRLRGSLLHIVQMMEAGLPGLMAVFLQINAVARSDSGGIDLPHSTTSSGKEYPLLSLRQFVPEADLRPQRPSFTYRPILAGL